MWEVEVHWRVGKMIDELSGTVTASYTADYSDHQANEEFFFFFFFSNFPRQNSAYARVEKSS